MVTETLARPKTVKIKNLPRIKNRKRSTAGTASKKAEKELSESYNEFKHFEGQQYRGMKVGRSHKWYDDKGEWRETKLTPDLWEICYSVQTKVGSCS